jgi:hypothetical protein
MVPNRVKVKMKNRRNKMGRKMFRVKNKAVYQPGVLGFGISRRG